MDPLVTIWLVRLSIPYQAKQTQHANKIEGMQMDSRPGQLVLIDGHPFYVGMCLCYSPLGFPPVRNDSFCFFADLAKRMFTAKASLPICVT